MNALDAEMAWINGHRVRRARARDRFRLLPLDQLRGLPIVNESTGGCGVYFLWGAMELLYVGKSNDIGYRYARHRKTKNFSHMTFERIPEEIVIACEAAYVRRYRPRLNQTRHG